MLSDEEKKAIEFVKSELQDEKIARNDYQSLTGLYGNLEIETVLNIIEKQSKEIEEAEQKERKAYIDGTNVAHELCNKMWEDKIKAKIEEVNAEELNLAFIISGVEYKEAITSALQSLLEKE